MRSFIDEIILGDAIDVMSQIPDQSIDAIISDPPYGTTALKWDERVDWSAWWVEALRICKPSANILLFAQQPFATDLIISNRNHFRYQIVWEKTMPMGFLDANRRPLRAHELILIFNQKPKGSTYNPQMAPTAKRSRNRSGNRSVHYGKTACDFGDNNGLAYPRDVIEFSNGNSNKTNTDRFHPTQKPLDLMQWLIRSYSNESDLVLDPFSGSGTTAIACKSLDRRFIAIERDPDYHQKSIDRLLKYQGVIASSSTEVLEQLSII
jgi:site-specific DNA-methyltransferase (adenine-specific)